MGTVAHHQERSHYYLHAARRGLGRDDYHYAAIALSRAATHSVTAAARRHGFPNRSQRRLCNLLIGLVGTRQIPLAHLRLFRRIHRLPDQIAVAQPNNARRRVRQDCRRVRALICAMDRVISDSQPAS